MRIIKEGQNSIDIIEYFRRKKIEISKAKLNVSASFTNEFGFSEEKTISYRTFRITNIHQTEGILEFSFNLDNYSTQELFVGIDIVDEKEDIIDSLPSIPFKNIENEVVKFKFNTSFNDYKDYYYRIYVSCPKEGWIDFEVYDENNTIIFEKGLIKVPLENIKISETNIDGGEFNYISEDFLYLFDHNIPIPELELELFDENNKFERGKYNKIIDSIRMLSNPIEEYNYQIDRDIESIIPLNNYTNYANRNNMIVGEPFEFNNYSNNVRYLNRGTTYNVFKNGLKLNPNSYRIEQGNDGLDKIYINKYTFDRNDKLIISTISKDLKDSEGKICSMIIGKPEEINLLNSIGIFIPSSHVGSLTTGTDLKCYIIKRKENSINERRLTPRRYHLFAVNDGMQYGVRAYIKEENLNVGDEIVIVKEKIHDNVLFNVPPLINPNDPNRIFTHYIPFSSIDFGELGNDVYGEDNNVEVFVNGFKLINGKDFNLISPYKLSNIPSMILFKDIIPFGSNIEMNHLKHKESSIITTKPIFDGKNFFIVNDFSKKGLNKLNIFIPDCFEIYIDRKKISNEDFEILNRNLIVIKRGSITEDSEVLIKFHYEQCKQKIRNYDNLLIKSGNLTENDLNLIKTIPANTPVNKDPETYNGFLTFTSDAEEIMFVHKDAYIELNVFSKYLVSATIKSSVEIPNANDLFSLNKNNNGNITPLDTNNLIFNSSQEKIPANKWTKISMLINSSKYDTNILFSLKCKNSTIKIANMKVERLPYHVGNIKPTLYTDGDEIIIEKILKELENYVQNTLIYDNNEDILNSILDLTNNFYNKLRYKIGNSDSYVNIAILKTFKDRLKVLIKGVELFNSNKIEKNKLNFIKFIQEPLKILFSGVIPNNVLLNNIAHLDYGQLRNEVDLLDYFLDVYYSTPDEKDKQTVESLMSEYSSKNTGSYERDNIEYKPLTEIQQLSSNYNFLKQIKKDIDKSNNENVIKLLDCNDYNNLTGEKEIYFENNKLPILFNHDIFVDMNIDFSNKKEFNDNIEIINTSRTYDLLGELRRELDYYYENENKNENLLFITDGFDKKGIENFNKYWHPTQPVTIFNLQDSFSILNRYKESVKIPSGGSIYQNIDIGEIIKGEYYTFSLNIKDDVYTNNTSAEIFITGDNGLNERKSLNFAYISNSGENKIPSSTTSRVYITALIPDNTTNLKVGLLSNNIELSINDMKFELGSKPTDYMSRLDDLDVSNYVVNIDCNNNNFTKNDVYLNENIDLNLPYVNKSINIDCNNGINN